MHMESSKFIAFYCKKNAVRGRTAGIAQGSEAIFKK